MSLLNTLLGSSKKLREFPAELHYGCIFPQFITSQSMGVSPAACPRAALPMRTKPQLPKEKSFSKGAGQRGDNNSKTERLWLPAHTDQVQLSHKPSLLLRDPIRSHWCFLYFFFFQLGLSLVQSLAKLLFQFPLWMVIPTAWGAGWQLREMLGKKRNVSG